MSIVSMRPTFVLHLPRPCAEVDRHMNEVLKSSEWSSTSLGFGRYAELHVPKSEVRYWTPHLSLQLESDDMGTKVFGRFAPRQEVWTLVWIVYLLLTFIAFFASIYAYSVWMLGETSWSGLVPPLAILGIIGLHIASRIGQRLSNDQMLALRNDCERLFQQAVGMAPTVKH